MSQAKFDTSHRMSPRERVLTALDHREPDRVPFSWGMGLTPEMWTTLDNYLTEEGIDLRRLQADTEDVRYIRVPYTGPELMPRVDIWGIEHKSQSYGAGSYNEIAFYPLAGVKTPAEIEEYPWPDPAAYDYVSLRERLISEDPVSYKARNLGIDTCGNPFEIYCWMTGLEDTLVNVLLNPELVHAALGKITDFFEAKIRRVLACCGDLMDICYFADDLGTQRNLIMSRRTYREVLQPYHRRLFSLAKELAPHASVMMHSDGAVFDIVPDLIDAGLDVLQAVQVDTDGMDPQRLKDTYGDQICFSGAISVQHLLPYSDKRTVFSECRRLVEIFATGGGYIASPTHAIQVGTPPENVLTMLRAVLGEEDYEAAIAAACL